jgi:hypothetical protein
VEYGNGTAPQASASCLNLSKSWLLDSWCVGMVTRPSVVDTSMIVCAAAARDHELACSDQADMVTAKWYR